MAFKLRAAVAGTEIVNKQYFFQMVDGPACRQFVYVTADAPALVESHGYIDTDDGDDSTQAFNMLREGDMIWVYQVAALDDTRTIEADIAAGLTDKSLHTVLTKTAKALDLSSDELVATVTYTV